MRITGNEYDKKVQELKKKDQDILEQLCRCGYPVASRSLFRDEYRYLYRGVEEK